MKEEWLMSGAVVPVDVETTAALVAEIRRLIDVVGGMALAQPEDRNFCPRCGKRTADLTTIHTCTPPVAAGSQAFYGFPTEPVSTPNAGGKCVTAGETAPTHTINTAGTVAVATDTYWLPIDKDTPRSVKLQLLSIGGVAQYGNLQADTSFYTHWCPVPKKPK
jgi:hypothetical protein